MAKKSDSKEKKEKRKKQAKYLAGICAAGFAFLLVNVMYKNYRDDKAEEFRLSSDRVTYYKDALSDTRKDREEVLSEFFNEMFVSTAELYEVDTERKEALIDKIAEAKDELDLSIELYNYFNYAEITCNCSFSEEMNLYADFINKVDSALWSNEENRDIGFRLYDELGNMIYTYWHDGTKYMDYNFNGELADKWNAVISIGTFSGFKNLDYEVVSISEEVALKKLEEFGTIIPYVTDLLTDKYNKNKPVKIVFTSDRSLGMEYIDKSSLDGLVDSVYAEEITDDSVPVIENDLDFMEESVSVEETEEVKLTAYSDLDFKTKELTYLSPDDYCEYTSYIEENELDYNPNIKPMSVENNKSVETLFNSNSWVCLFGNPRLYDEIGDLARNTRSSNISYQLMFYLYGKGNVSLDLSMGMDIIMDNIIG